MEMEGEREKIKKKKTKSIEHIYEDDIWNKYKGKIYIKPFSMSLSKC